MFGYIRAYKPEMKFKDYDIYKGVYCSLCKELGKRYGLIARLTLSYDFTFFAMVRMAVRTGCVKFRSSRCTFNPAKKCLDCGRGNEDTAYTADISMLMMYHKLRDNIADSGFFKRLLCLLAMPYAKHVYKKAKQRQPEAAKIIEEQMSRQSEIESRNAGLDEAADPSAKMLSLLLALKIGCDNIESLKQFGYMTGRWVYIIDAADDCADDIKDGSFNPLKKRFEEESFSAYCGEMLNLTMGEAINNYKKLKINRFNDILENILYDGSEAVVNTVLKKGCACEKSV